MLPHHMLMSCSNNPAHPARNHRMFLPSLPAGPAAQAPHRCHAGPGQPCGGGAAAARRGHAGVAGRQHRRLLQRHQRALQHPRRVLHGTQLRGHVGRQQGAASCCLLLLGGCCCRWWCGACGAEPGMALAAAALPGIIISSSDAQLKSSGSRRTSRQFTSLQ